RRAPTKCPTRTASRAARASSRARRHRRELPTMFPRRRYVAAAIADASRILAAAQVGGERLLNFSGRRQTEVVHEVDEFGAGAAGEARVAALFDPDRRRGAALVVVAGEDQRRVGEREEAGVDRVEERAGIAALEVGAAAGADQERVAGEDPVT